MVVEVSAGAAGSTLANVATVDGGILDPRPQDNEASVSTPVGSALTSDPPLPLVPQPQSAPDGSPVFTITKTVDRASADTATELTYTITITNRGAAPARQVLVSDTFSDRVTLLSVTSTAGTCTRSPLACRIDVIAAGGSVVVTVRARALDPGRLTNSAAVTAANASAVGTVAPAGVSVAAARTSLSLKQRAASAMVRPGGRVTFFLTVRNRGAHAAFGVRVCARPPRELAIVSAARARIRGRAVCWTIGRLAAHAGRTLSLRVRAGRADGSRRSTRLSSATAAGVRADSSRRVTNRSSATATNAATVRAAASITIDRVAGPLLGGVTG